MIKKFQTNAQILLYYDFVTIILNILQELYGKENEYEEYYKSIFSFLKEISKYFNKDLLMTYLNKVFIFFKKNILSEIQVQENFDIMPVERRGNEANFDLYGSTDFNEQEEQDEINNNIDNVDILNNEEEENRDRFAKLDEEEKSTKNKLFLDLLELLKNKFDENYEKENYFILSNHTFPNHLINNLLYLDNLKIIKEICDTYIGFKLFIKINSYKGINGFKLLELINRKERISFIINNNFLEIKEGFNNEEIILKKIGDFDRICPEGEFHNIILNFETKTRTFEMRINDKIIVEQSTTYKNFVFDEFGVIIGFSNNLVNYKANYINNEFSNIKNDPEQNIIISKNEEVCFVYISYLLISSTLIEDEKIIQVFKKKEKSHISNQSFLNQLYKMEIGHRNWGKLVVAEIDFQNMNMDLLYSQEIPVKSVQKNLLFSSEKGPSVNKYISCKRLVNNFKVQNPVNYMYLIANNNNICEFCSLNEIWVLEKINK